MNSHRLELYTEQRNQNINIFYNFSKGSKFFNKTIRSAVSQSEFKQKVKFFLIKRLGILWKSCDLTAYKGVGGLQYNYFVSNADIILVCIIICYVFF